jgi:SAM-dependent methyltransferase
MTVRDDVVDALKGTVAYDLLRRVKRRLVPLRSNRPTERAFARKRIALDRLLLGGENGIGGEKFARLIHDPMRLSRRTSESPHAKFLRAWKQQGAAIFEPGMFERSEYYLNAAENVDILGHYFDAKSEDQIIAGARRFVDYFRGADTSRFQPQVGQTPAGQQVRVCPVQFSDCFQLIDGHHRAAMAVVRGEQEIDVEVGEEAVLTPLQQLLLDVLWLDGRKALYQPVAAPELACEWALVRKCTDRLEKMIRFLDARKIAPNGTSYLDLACSYGWFVDGMLNAGYDATGVERDPIALEVGQVAYGLPSERTSRSDCVRFLLEHPRRWDVVSCFSLLHHFVLGNGRISAEEMIRLLDRATGRVLFLDMGQSHEAWFAESLEGWTPSFIQQWLLEHTTFMHVEQLGPDEDAVPPFEHQYGRMLFACCRDSPGMTGWRELEEAPRRPARQ